VHRLRAEGYVEVHVQKVKFRHLGQPGMCTFRYNINNGRYVPFDPKSPDSIQWDNRNHLNEKMRDGQQQAEPDFPFDFDPPAGDCPY
jgi:twinkle protein